MSASVNPDIVTDGLVLCLDAANPDSYPGSGNTWYDLSGNNRDYAIRSGVQWSNNSFFCASDPSAAFTGPPSNSFDFNANNEHTIISFMDLYAPDTNTIFRWRGTPVSGTSTQAISANWSANSFYYCGGTYLYTAGLATSLSLTNGTYVNGLGYVGNIFCGIWRNRKNISPYRSFFSGLTERASRTDSAAPNVNWNLTDNAYLWYNVRGKIYNFLTYNRALSDDELKQNYKALKGRYGL